MRPSKEQDAHTGSTPQTPRGTHSAPAQTAKLSPVTHEEASAAPVKGTEAATPSQTVVCGQRVETIQQTGQGTNNWWI